MSVERISIGQIVPVILFEEGRKEGQGKFGTVILQARTKFKDGNATTVEFTSLQESWGDQKAGQSTATLGGNTYTVTHPPRDATQPTLIGFRKQIGSDPRWFLTYLENLANKLEVAGREDRRQPSPQGG